MAEARSDERMLARVHPEAPLRTRLVSTANEAMVARMWQGIAQRRQPRLPSMGELFRLAALSGAIGALLLLAGLWVVDRPHSTVPVAPPAQGSAELTLADGRPLVKVSSRAKAEQLSLSDGSEIRLEPGSVLEPLAVVESRVSWSLRRGRGYFEVKPGGKRRWTVQAGFVTVEVVGTRFSIERGESWVRVVVDRGAVLVRGDDVADGVQRLVAGERLEVRHEVRHQEMAGGSSPAPSEAKPPATVSPAPSAARESAPLSLPSAWRAHAERGNYTAAFENLGPAGLRRAAGSARSPDELMRLADVARLSGHPEDALAPLEAVLRRFDTSPEAPLAAMTLGRTLLSLGRPSDAASALERAIAAGLPSGLMEDAFVRLARAHAKAGNLSRARAVLGRYDARFPNGRRRAAVVAATQGH